MRGKRRILLVGLNARYHHTNLALRYLKRYCRGCPVEILLAEYTVNSDAEQILGDILKYRPSVAAFSVYIWNAEQVRLILKGIRMRSPETVLVLGGPEVSYNAEKWLSDIPSPDFLITGAGEAGFRALLERDFLGEGPIINLKNPPFREIPFPYSEEDLSGLDHRYLYYESSRGCPFRCSYCVSSRSDQFLEFRDTETVLRELDFLLGFRPGLIKFVDRTFNVRGGRSREIWEYLMETYARSGTVFHFEIHPAFLDDRDFQLLARCPGGLFQFELGIQSTHEQTLQAVGRKQDWEEVRDRMERLQGMKNIHLHADLIAGLPFEGLQELEKSFNRVYALGCDHLQLGILKLLPGTNIREETERFGILYRESSPYGVRATAWLDEESLILVERAARLVEVLHNAHKMDVTLKELIHLSGSPFMLFYSFARWERALTLPALHQGWEEAALRIGEYVKRFHPDSSRFMGDALRWDWCCLRSLHYPKFLKPAAYQAKKRGVLRDLLLAAGHNGPDSPPGNLKSSLLFIPDTEAFRSKYLGVWNMALFPVPSGDVMYL